MESAMANEAGFSKGFRVQQSLGNADEISSPPKRKSSRQTSLAGEPAAPNDTQDKKRKSLSKRTCHSKSSSNLLGGSASRKTDGNDVLRQDKSVSNNHSSHSQKSRRSRSSHGSGSRSGSATKRKSNRRRDRTEDKVISSKSLSHRSSSAKRKLSSQQKEQQQRRMSGGSPPTLMAMPDDCNSGRDPGTSLPSLPSLMAMSKEKSGHSPDSPATKAPATPKVKRRSPSGGRRRSKSKNRDNRKKRAPSPSNDLTETPLSSSSHSSQRESIAQKTPPSTRRARPSLTASTEKGKGDSSRRSRSISRRHRSHSVGGKASGRSGGLDTSSHHSTSRPRQRSSSRKAKVGGDVEATPSRNGSSKSRLVEPAPSSNGSRQRIRSSSNHGAAVRGSKSRSGEKSPNSKRRLVKPPSSSSTPRKPAVGPRQTFTTSQTTGIINDVNVGDVDESLLQEFTQDSQRQDGSGSNNSQSPMDTRGLLEAESSTGRRSKSSWFTPSPRTSKQTLAIMSLASPKSVVPMTRRSISKSSPDHYAKLSGNSDHNQGMSSSTSANNNSTPTSIRRLRKQASKESAGATSKSRSSISTENDVDPITDRPTPVTPGSSTPKQSKPPVPRRSMSMSMNQITTLLSPPSTRRSLGSTDDIAAGETEVFVTPRSGAAAPRRSFSIDRARGKEIAAEQMAMVLASPTNILPRRSFSADRPHRKSYNSVVDNDSGDDLEIPSLKIPISDTASSLRDSGLDKSRSTRSAGTALTRRKSRQLASLGMDKSAPENLTAMETSDNFHSHSKTEVRRVSTTSSRRRRRSSQLVASTRTSTSDNDFTFGKERRPSLTVEEEAAIVAAAAAAATPVQSNLNSSIKQRSRRMSQQQHQRQSRSSRCVSATIGETPTTLTYQSEVVGARLRDRAYSEISNEEHPAGQDQQDVAVSRRIRHSSIKKTQSTEGEPHLTRSNTLEESLEDVADKQDLIPRSRKQQPLSRRATLATFGNSTSSNVKKALMMDRSDPAHKVFKRSSTLEGTISPALQRRVSLLSPFEVDNDSVMENAIAAVAKGAVVTSQSPPRQPMGRSKTFDDRQRPGMSVLGSSLSNIAVPGVAGSSRGLQRQNSFTYSKSSTRGGTVISSVARRLLKRCESESAIQGNSDNDDYGMDYLIGKRQSSDLTGSSLLEVNEDDLEKTQHTVSTSEVSTLSSSNERRSPLAAAKPHTEHGAARGPSWRSKWEASLQFGESFHTSGADSFTAKEDGMSKSKDSKTSDHSSLSMKLCGNTTSIRHQDRGDIMFVDIDDDTVSALSYQQQTSSLDGNTISTNSKSFDLKSILSSETFTGKRAEAEAIEGADRVSALSSEPSPQALDGDVAIKSKRIALTKLQSVSSMIKF